MLPAERERQQLVPGVVVGQGAGVEAVVFKEQLQVERKVFSFELRENPRGRFLKITEDVGGNRDTIMVPAEILGDFIAALQDIKATADSR